MRHLSPPGGGKLTNNNLSNNPRPCNLINNNLSNNLSNPRRHAHDASALKRA